MPYIEHTSEKDWCKRLFDRLKTVENKLDQLLVLKEQSVDTTTHPPLKPEYLDFIYVSKIFKVEQKLNLEEMELVSLPKREDILLIMVEH